MTEQAATPAQPPDTFDVQVCERIRKTFAEVFTAHPEVRSLSCSIDWAGALNDANIMHGVWIGDNGVVGAPDAVFGSIAQTLRMLDNQCSRALELNQHLREQCGVLATEVLNKHAELKRLNEEVEALEARKATLGKEGPTGLRGDPG